MALGIGVQVARRRQQFIQAAYAPRQFLGDLALQEVMDVVPERGHRQRAEYSRFSLPVHWPPCTFYKYKCWLGGLVAWLRLRIEQQRNLEALPARALLPLVGCAAAPQVIERPEEVRVPVAVPCAHRPAYLPHLVRGVA
ncbi:hypothetical protein [Cupriavidus sp. D39]|uniref:hypothetical protein n=1 Tax=Cupriavidus sp. D39 TaxID=2997877 RepID=UPI0022716884|nr:hypothetical protein [Cupriavidus sp. D39]MCY0855613.1 hypothetical protein [Cupriavidus sp. D39]